MWKKRDGFDRFIAWICILSIALNDVALEINFTILLMFTNSRLGWNVSNYSVYQAVDIIITIFGVLTLIKLGGSIIGKPYVLLTYCNFQWVNLK